MANKAQSVAPSSKRAIIYVPIIHTAADLGSKAEALRGRLRARIGEAAVQRRDAAIQRMWGAVRENLLGLEVEWARVRIYQDGLPVCGREREIVEEVAAAGSPNYALVLELCRKGATLMGAEDPRLLVQELARVEKLLSLDSKAARPEDEVLALKEQGDRLLAERDAFIARRIDETLGPGEVGIVFMGLLHHVNERLPKEEIRMLMPDLPFGAD